MKKHKHIDFLNECAVNEDFEGEMTFDGLGLCNSTMPSDGIDSELLELFEPTFEDLEWLKWEGHSRIYWGSGGPSGMIGILTPLRATIVMFMAAMNGEL